MRTFNAQSIRVSLGALATLPVAVLLASGCGSTAANTVTATQGNAAAFIVGTDAPLPSVTAFNVQLQSITATNAAGTSVSLLSGSPTVDFARFNGLQTLIDMNDVPADTYTSVTVTLGTASIGYLNVTPGAAPTIQTEAATLTTNTITKTLAVPLVLSETAPVGLHMDFDLRKSIQVDSTGNITGAVTPTFNLSVVGRSDSGAYIDEFDAAVVSVNQSAQTFTIEGPHGRQFTVDVNGQTEWDNGEGLGDLTTSSIVQISGTLDRADSTFDADDVSIVSQNGFFAAGLLTYVAPSTSPATSFDLYVHGLLPSTTGLTLGQIAQVDLTGNEKYFIRRMHDPLTKYLFNSSTLLPGQHVNIGGPASGATDPTAVSVKRISLRPRGYNATVVAGSVSMGGDSFQVQINDFAGLLIPQTVTVYADSNTAFRENVSSLSGLQGGDNVRVVGLLLKDPSSGNTVLLARYVDILQ